MFYGNIYNNNKIKKAAHSEKHVSNQWQTRKTHSPGPHTMNSVKYSYNTLIIKGISPYRRLEACSSE